MRPFRSAQSAACVRSVTPIARNTCNCLTDDRFGAVILRSIEKVDADIDRSFDKRDCITGRLRVVAHAEAARAAATESGDTYLDAGST